MIDRMKTCMEGIRYDNFSTILEMVIGDTVAQVIDGFFLSHIGGDLCTDNS
jgi:hypothetical protein